MDSVRNPYGPGAGSPPPVLAGRDTELKALDIAVQRLAVARSAKSLMLTGLRAVCKAVLLREFGRIDEHHGWVYQQIEATGDLRMSVIGTSCGCFLLDARIGFYRPIEALPWCSVAR